MKTTTLATRIDSFWALTTILLAGLILTSQAAAMPPHPAVQEKIERGLVKAPSNAAFDPSLPHNMKLNAASGVSSPAATGPFRALCILVDFSDNQSQTNSLKFDTLIYANRSGTVKHYYQEVSYGQLDIITVDLPSSLGWQRAPHTYDYYVDGGFGIESPYPNNTQGLCVDLVNQVDPYVDFSQYDNNGDGLVDVVMIAHSGRGAEFTGSPDDIWSHKWSISPLGVDGVAVSDYTVMPEYWNTPGDMTIGVFCHELGHAFGLPDLYDTDGSSYGIGYWSLMSTGSWNGNLGNSPAHPDAWCRTRLGWVTPTNISTNVTGVSIPRIETNPTAFRLWTSGLMGDEYYLVENRQNTGYDNGLPGSGLLIWHIDEAVENNNNEWYPGHIASGHFKVALEQADNMFQLEQRDSYGNGGDPYPGSTNNTAFSPTSSPSSEGYAGSNSFVSVLNISPSSSNMTADFAVSFASDNDEDDPVALPQFSLGQNYPNPFNPSTNIDFSLPDGGQVEITIYNILGNPVARLAGGYHPAGSHTVVWDGTDENGEDVPGGVYLYVLITEEQKTARKMLLLK